MDDLAKRLKEAGSVGLDLSPGDPLCAEAASKLTKLTLERRKAVSLLARVVKSFDDNNPEKVADAIGEAREFVEEFYGVEI